MLSIQDTSTWPQSGDPRCLCLPRGRGHTRTCKSRVGSSGPSSPLQISTFPPPPPPRQRCSPMDRSPAPPKRTLNRGWELLAPLRPFQRRAPAHPPAVLSPCRPGTHSPLPNFPGGGGKQRSRWAHGKVQGGQRMEAASFAASPLLVPGGGSGSWGRLLFLCHSLAVVPQSRKPPGTGQPGGGEACPEGKEGEKGTRRGGVRVLSAPSPALQAPTTACAEGERLEGGGVAFSSSTNVLTKS